MNDPEGLALAEISPEEKEIVDLLLASTSQLAEVIPDTIDPDTLWATLSASCHAMTTYRRRIGVLKPLIGRALILLRDHPEIYRAMGCLTYDSFMSDVLPSKLGVPRSEGYAAVRLVEHFPSLTVEQCQAIKFNKLQLLSQFTNENSPDADRYLRLAQLNSYDALKDICANNGVLPREDSDLATITILTTKGRKDTWSEFARDPQVRAYVGSDDPGTILEMCLGECRATWMAHAMLQMQEQHDPEPVWITAAPPAEA